MYDLIARARVVLTATVTWLVTLAAVLTAAAGPLTDALGVGHPLVELLARIVVVLGVAVAIISRVAPVLPEARGVLDPPDGVPVTAREAELAGQLRTVITAARHPDDPVP